MPFTPSHAAAVLPFRQQLPLSALVIGSMSPDFDYFVRLSFDSRYSHTLEGIVVFSVPLGLGVYVLFHRFIKYPLFALLPESEQRRLMPALLAGDEPFSWRRFRTVLLALFVGALTHSVWDSFTHLGYVVKLLPVLETELLRLGETPIEVYKLLQDLSTVAGATVLTAAYMQWRKSAIEFPVRKNLRLSMPAKLLTLMLIGIAMALGAMLFGVSQVPDISTAWRVRKFASRAAVGGIAAGFAAVCFYSLLWRVAQVRKASEYSV